MTIYSTYIKRKIIENLDRKPKKRGTKAFTSGISNEKEAVIATRDRYDNKDFKVAKQGRISKKDVMKFIDGNTDKAEVLCRITIEVIVLLLKCKGVTQKIQRLKRSPKNRKRCHAQHMGKMDKRLREFMQSFNGVVTKHLQNRMNWFLALEKIKIIPSARQLLQLSH